MKKINPFFYLVLAFLLFNFFVIPVVLHRYYNFELFSPNDLCGRVQAIFNAFRGKPLFSTIWPWCGETNFSVFGDHFYVFLFILIPFCYFIKNPEWLLVLQTVFLSASIFPLFLIALQKLKDKWLSLVICICFLLYPLTMKFPFYDLRLEYFSVFFLFWAFYFLETEKIKSCLMCLSLSVLAKENLLVVSAFFGGYAFLFKRGRKYKYLGVSIAVISAAILLLYWKVIGPYFAYNNDYQPIHHYVGFKDVIANPQLYFGRMFSHDKISFLLGLFKFLWFIPILSKEIILVVPGLLQNIMSDLFNGSPIFVVVNIWHSAVILPFLFISFVYGIGNLLEFLKLNSKSKWYIPFLTVIFLYPIIQGAGEFRKTVLENYKGIDSQYLNKSLKYKQLLEIKEALPKEERIIVHLPLVYMFYDFEKVLLWHDRFLLNPGSKYSAEYIIYSEDITYSTKYQKSAIGDDRDIIKSKIPEGAYEGLFRENGFVVLKKKEKPFNISLNGGESESNDVEYVVWNKLDRLLVDVEFDGDEKEDEYVKIKWNDLGINLGKYNWIEMEYMVENAEIQTIEVIVGIDTDSDGEADLWNKGLYPLPASQRDDVFTVSLYNILGDRYINKKDYSLVSFEVYPHKIWGKDCTRKKDVYSFLIYEIKLT